MGCIPIPSTRPLIVLAGSSRSYA